MSDRRPKRRCVAAKAQQVVPSAIHYVGYVEDDETPEMIMKKFEELERIQKAAEARRQQQQQQQGPNGQGPPGAPQLNPDLGSGVGDASASTSTPPQAAAFTAIPTEATAQGFAAAASGPSGGSGPKPGPGSAAGSGAATGTVGDPSFQDPSQQQQSSVLPQQQQHHAGHPPEDITAAASGGGGNASEQMLLDEEALLELFRQTSRFRVRTGNGLLGSAAVALYDIAYGMEDMLFVGGGGGGFGGVGGELGAGASDPEDEELQQQMRDGFWSDEDYELGGRSRDGGRRRRAQGAAGGGGYGRQRSQSGDGEGGSGREAKPSRGAGVPGGQSRHVMNQVVMQYNRDTNALIRRRVPSGGSGATGIGIGGASGGSGLVQLRVPPPPLPLSWGRTARPYQPPEPYQPPTAATSDGGAALEAGEEPAADTAAVTGAAAAAATAASLSRGFEAADLTMFPYDTALGGKQYIAVMVNAGWQPVGAADAFEAGHEADVMRRFRSLPIPRLCPRGFVLVWAHKGLLQAVCRALSGWGYVYVENLTWVHLSPANAIAAQPGRHFRRSHSTLLIFRREGEGRDIELRHQRNPDVVFDCIGTRPDGCGWQVPSEVLTTVETMLPGGRGAFLELWSPRGQRRPGWDHVSEVPQ